MIMKKNISTKIFIAVFLVFLSVMGYLYYALPAKEYSSAEKRVLAQVPEISVKRVLNGSFSKDFEEFLADQTPFRSFYVGVNSYFELLKGNNGTNGIYLGKEGMLIEKPVENSDRLDINIKRINSFAKEVSPKIYVISAPQKGWVYDNLLPKNHLEYKDKEYTNTLKTELDKSITYIDLSDILKANREKNLLYFNTDHHWNSEGAFLGYKKICSVIGIEEPSEKDYNITKLKDKFYGTSYSKSGYFLTKSDYVNVWKSKENEGNAKVTIDHKDITVHDSMFFDELENEENKYIVFLNGDSSVTNIETEAKGGTLMVIKDSFANVVIPFFADNYSKIVVVDLRYYKQNLSDLIAEQDIDEIMFMYRIENYCTSRDIILE